MAPMIPIIDMLIATVSMIKGPEKCSDSNEESEGDEEFKWVVSPEVVSFVITS